MINLHIIYTHITGLGLYDGMRSQDWLEKRIEIFKNFTLKSLLNQTNKKFLHWLAFRPQDKNNPAIVSLFRYLKSLNYEFVATFNGVMIYDDKFSGNPIDILKNGLRVIRYWYRNKKIEPKLLIEIFKNKNKTLEMRLQKSLDKLIRELNKDIVFLNSKDIVDYVYLSRIDSDDMFSSDFVETIQVQPEQEGTVLTCNDGYVYNHLTKQVADWQPTTNPPFYTIIFPTKTFFNAQENLKYIEGFKSHEDIVKILNPYSIGDGYYMVSVQHGNNISTIWGHPFRKYIYPNSENILKKFGVVDK